MLVVSWGRPEAQNQWQLQTVGANIPLSLLTGWILTAGVLVRQKLAEPCMGH